MKHLPVTKHQVRAALYVARTVDSAGSDATSVARAYAHAVTDGMHRYADLERAEQALLSAGLLWRDDQRLMPSITLCDATELPDDDAVDVLEAMLSGAHWRWSESAGSSVPAELANVMLDVDRRVEVGAAAEEVVLQHCRLQLKHLGREDLARKTKRVSLISDALGFDILAPMIGGSSRQLEVKGQTTPPGSTVRFFISRNEYEVGRRSERWALVCCSVDDASHHLGWCRAVALEPYLPVDRNGRWTEAVVMMPRSALTPGIPDPI